MSSFSGSVVSSRKYAFEKVKKNERKDDNWSNNIKKRSKYKRDYGLDINLLRQQKKERNCLIGHRVVERTRRKGSEKASAKEESRDCFEEGGNVVNGVKCGRRAIVAAAAAAWRC